ncbi:MAG: hypothetical protein FIA91_04285 [Geobacter sp.]|nr:hypothetical protein [Geobacter sp.]
MSGGDYSGGGYDPEVEVSCSMLIDNTVLNSPKPEVIAKLKVDDVLDLQLIPSGAAKVLTAVTIQGEVAGSITSSLLSKIIRCIEVEHFSYVAIVKDISGGRCEVIIRPKGLQ